MVRLDCLDMMPHSHYAHQVQGSLLLESFISYARDCSRVHFFPPELDYIKN